MEERETVLVYTVLEILTLILAGTWFGVPGVVIVFLLLWIMNIKDRVE